MATTKSAGLSAAEKQAIKDRAKELKASQKKDKLEKDMLDKIADMPPDEQKVATTIHEIVKELAPHLTAKTRYGMPTWAQEDGTVVLFFQAASKFGTRYSSLGFDEGARLDEGTMWPTSWALTGLTAADAKKVRALVSKAVS